MRQLLLNPRPLCLPAPHTCTLLAQEAARSTLIGAGAASFGQCKAIEALCAAGADPRRPANTAGYTPLSDAERERHTKAIELIQEYLSGARSIGVTPLASAVGVVVGECVTSGKAAVAKGKTPEGETPLFEIVDVLKRELRLSGTMKEVIDQAAESLGLSSKGKNLHDLAKECAQQLGI